jgi:hypothetical protein
VIPAVGVRLFVPEDSELFLARESEIVHATDVQVDASLDLLYVARIALNRLVLVPTDPFFSPACVPLMPGPLPIGLGQDKGRALEGPARPA